MHRSNNWGGLTTGVIDPDTKRVYLVAWVSPNNPPQPDDRPLSMFVLNVADGSRSFLRS